MYQSAYLLAVEPATAIYNMQQLIVLSALVAVAVAAPSSLLAGPIAAGSLVQGPTATIAGPSGTIVADTGAIATAAHTPAAAVLAPSLLGRSIFVGPSAGLIAPGVLGVNTLNAGLLGVPRLLGNVIVA